MRHILLSTTGLLPSSVLLAQYPATDVAWVKLAAQARQILWRSLPREWRGAE